MTDRDSRSDLVHRYVRHVIADAASIGAELTVTTATVAPPRVPAPCPTCGSRSCTHETDIAPRRAPTGLPSDPTYRAILAHEQHALRQANALADLLLSADRITHHIADWLPEPLDTLVELPNPAGPDEPPLTLLRLAHEPVEDDDTRPRGLLRTMPPTHRHHRLTVDAGAYALTIIAGAIQDAWWSAWNDATDDFVLNVVVRQLEELRRETRRLASNLLAWNAPPTAACAPQPELVYCRHHPDKLAKYRKLQLCGACYQRRQRAAS